jgi:hypothetical protein
MCEVYRAEDVRLNLEIAFKVLPEALVEDAKRLAYFEREAMAAKASSMTTKQQATRRRP